MEKWPFHPYIQPYTVNFKVIADPKNDSTIML